MKTNANCPEPGLPLERTGTPSSGTARYSAVKLLVALVLLFVVTPFVEELPGGALVETALLTLVMLSAVLAVGAQRRTMVFAILLVTPTLIGKWANHVAPSLVHPAFFLATAMAFFTFVIAHLLLFVARAPRVDANVLCAGVAGYLMLGLLWVPAYLLVARLSPAAFEFSSGPAASRVLDGFNAFYFSFITLTTVGYGDVLPVSRLARMLALLEAIAGMFYMAVLISRLVSAHSSTQPSAEEVQPPTQT